ncbi:MAG: hypothetical protein ACRDH5_12165 [bacterium]
MAIHLKRRLTEWGNGFGIRLTKTEARELGVRAGDVVEAEVRSEPEPNDVASLPAYRLGGSYSIDEILEDEADAGA